MAVEETAGPKIWTHNMSFINAKNNDKNSASTRADDISNGLLLLRVWSNGSPSTRDDEK